MENFKILNDYETLSSKEELPEPTQELNFCSYVIGNLTLGQLYTCIWNQKENKGEWKYQRHIMSYDPLEQRLNFETNNIKNYSQKINELILINPIFKQPILSDLREGFSLKEIFEKYCDKKSF